MWTCFTCACLATIWGQTGLVPVLLYEQYGEVMPDQRVCYTIHNFRHQGTSTEDVLWAAVSGRCGGPGRGLADNGKER